MYIFADDGILFLCFEISNNFYYDESLFVVQADNLDILYLSYMTNFFDLLFYLLLGLLYVIGHDYKEIDAAKSD